MTTSTPNKSDLPVYDFSDDNKIAKALNDAPAVKAIKSKGLVPTPKKAAPKAKGKAGRIVGISADENKFIYKILTTLDADSIYADMMEENKEVVAKLLARFNK